MGESGEEGNMVTTIRKQKWPNEVKSTYSVPHIPSIELKGVLSDQEKIVRRILLSFYLAQCNRVDFLERFII